MLPWKKCNKFLRVGSSTSKKRRSCYSSVLRTVRLHPRQPRSIYFSHDTSKARRNEKEHEWKKKAIISRGNADSPWIADSAVAFVLFPLWDIVFTPDITLSMIKNSLKDFTYVFIFGIYCTTGNHRERLRKTCANCVFLYTF